MTSTMITIAVPLTRADRQQAQSFKDQQLIAEKADQIYENTLAVLATHHYLDMIDVPTDLDRSYSQDPSTFLASNIADLYVPGARGRLECRVVHEGENACFIPTEVWSNRGQRDRIGYVVVRLNETNTEATVLGFVSEVSVEHLPLSYLRSLDDLIDVVWDNGSVKQPDSKRSLTSRIRVWLERKIASGWQLAPGLGLTTLELSADVGYRSESHLRDHEIVGNDSADIFWRKIENLWVTDPQNPSGGSRIEKDISEYLGGQPIGLKIAVVESKNENFAIQARVFSRENNIQLPCSIQLRGITANGDCFSQVESRVTPLDDYIRICFIAEPQESFQIEVTWNNYKFVESFPSLESSPF